MITLLAVRSNAIGSRIIRWGLGEAASHFAIMLDGGPVVESDLARGFHLTDRLEFLASHDIVKMLPLSAGSQLLDMQIITKVILALKFQSYDRPGFLYFSWRALLRKLLGIPFPSRNNWQKDDLLLCVEVLYAFLDVWATMTGQSPSLTDRVFGMMSPLDCIRFVEESIPCSVPGRLNLTS